MIAYRLTMHDNNFERRLDVIGYYLHAHLAVEEVERRCAADFEAWGGEWPCRKRPGLSSWKWGQPASGVSRATKHYGWNAYVVESIHVHEAA